MIHSLFKLLGYELCRLNANELAELPSDLPLNYKEFQLQRAIGAPGQLSVDEARFLGELVRRSDPSRPIIEIGTLFGWSTLVISLFKPKSQRLITIDNYSWNPLGLSSRAHHHATTQALRQVVASHNVTQLRMDKDEFFRSYTDAQPALFFCDADHSYEATKADLLWARSVGADIICGDDYRPGYHLGVVKAVDELGGPRELMDELFVL
jgi:hypothetical protein